MEKADLLLFNGKIQTVSEDLKIVDALVIRDGRILAAGTAEVLRNKFEVVNEKDLQGHAVYPGFIDAHCHFYGYGMQLMHADLQGCNSFQEVLDRVQAHQAQYASE